MSSAGQEDDVVVDELMVVPWIDLDATIVDPALEVAS
jgi:hypothetical protein